MTTFLFSLPPRSTFVGRSGPSQGRNGPGRRWAPMALLLALSFSYPAANAVEATPAAKKRRLQWQVNQSW